MNINYFKIFGCLFVIFIINHAIANEGSAMFDGEYSRFYIGDNQTPANPEANQEVFKISGTSITMEAWIYLVELPKPEEKQTIISRNFYDPSNSFYLTSYELRVSYVSPNSFPRIEFYLSGEGDTEAIVGSIAAPTIGEWIHVAGTYDGTAMKLYLNGIQVNYEPFTANINSWDEIDIAYFYIGARYGIKHYFYGCIDEVRLWNITCSQSEIEDNMDGELTGEENGLCGYWTLGIQDVETAVDYTDNHNDLTYGLELPYKPPIFIDFDHLNLGTSAVLEIPQNINLGACEVGVLKFMSIQINNTGDRPCYGKFYVTGSNILDSTTDNRFLIAPDSSTTIITKLIPQITGQLEGVLNFNEGNAENLPQSIPIQIESVDLEGFDSNNIGMWMINSGRFAYNPFNGTSGLYWPLAEKKNVIYSSGIWVGAIINGEKRAAVCSHWSEFRPGPVGEGINPDDPKYRFYKINRGDDSNNPDYAQWPADLGAPVNADGSPKIIGDQTLFMVYNDSDPSWHFDRYGTTPMGVEIQQTVFGFNDVGSLSNTVFLRFKILNKSTDIWNDTYCSLWSDPDLGYFNDDFVGIDIDRTLGYCYNGIPSDDIYGSDIPAVGYDILKGAFYTNPIQAFAYYTGGSHFPYGDPDNIDETYNFMSGKLADGSEYKDPDTDVSTKFPLSGDPVTKTGWCDSIPGDRRFLFSTGPFTLEPNQAKEIIAAIIVARGDDYLDSVTKLKSASEEIQNLYNNGSIFGGALENVTSEDFEANESGTIDDIENSGAEVGVTADENGAVVEIASFVEPPSGAEDMEGSSIHGVGNFLDIQVEGNLVYPVQINMYYTQNDLDQAGITEDDLEGIYYWNADQDEWILYSNSGSDDQGRGTSITGVDQDNLVISENNYEGKVWAEVYHLTPICIGTKVDTTLIGIYINDLNTVSEYSLRQNYPNPFNPSTTIEYSVPMQSKVNIEIYDILGRHITTLYNGINTTGVYKLQWNAITVSAGIYFVKIHCISSLNNKQFLDIKKMVLMK